MPKFSQTTSQPLVLHCGPHRSRWSRFFLTLLLFGGIGLLMSQSLRAENWPQWRGPAGDGTSAETSLPVKWSATENIEWKVAIPYTGHASPIVWGETIFVTGVDEANERRMLMALDRRDGKVRWERTVLEAPLEKVHKLNSRSSSTPATDGERVYVSFLDRDSMCVAAYDLVGNEVWNVRPGPFKSVHGYCSSPILFENLLIVNGDHDGDAYIVAIDRKTGETVWKTPRENRTRSYCTPIIREINGRTQMMLSGSKCVASFDPRTGKRQWIIDGPTEQFVASLVDGNGLLFLTGGFPDKHIMAIDPTGEGNVTKTHVRWHVERNGVSYVPSPIACGRYFLVTSDGGIGTCFDAENGDVVWQERMGRHYSTSLTKANGLVYFLDDDGVTKVVRPGPTYDLIAENSLNEECYASPAISNGQLFIRGAQHLYCIGQPNATP
ncbi:MAG: PQQ-binding-like beta-propeller repeat protein [Planctomycetaceae bacterium]